MDVTQPKSVESVFAQIREHGPLDVLVNNAGIGVFTPYWERDYDEFMQVMSVNVGGTFLCTREALRLMRDQGQGAIINIGSIYGVVSSDPRIYTDCARMNSEAYSASKSAVIHMTKYFAVHGFVLGFNELTVYFLSTLDGPLEVHIALSLKRKGSRPKKQKLVK